MKKFLCLVKKELIDFYSIIKLLYIFAPIYAIKLTILRGICISTPIIRLYTITNLLNQIELVLNKNTSLRSIILPVGLLLLTEFINGISDVIFQELAKKCNIFIKKNKYPELIEQISQLEYCNFENSNVMDMLRRIKQNFNTRIVNSYTTSLYILESIVIAFLLIIIITSQVGVIGLLFSFLSIPLILAGQKSAKDLYEADEEAEKHNRYLEYLESLLKGRDAAAERRLFQFQDKIQNKWEESYSNAFIINQKVKYYTYKRALFSDLVTFSGYALSIGLLCWSLISNRISYGMFIAIIISILRLMNTLSYTLTGDLTQMGRNKLFLDDYTKMLQIRREKGAVEEAMDSINFEKLEFVDVTFTYPNAKNPTLKNLSFTMERGKKYAFVGENGAGKSTIIKLLLRLYSPDKGEILINGQSITNYSYGELKGLYAVVFQDFSKYQISLKESLCLGMRNIEDKKLVEVLKYVGLDRCIDENSQVIDYELGKLSENSIEFSGGQWQRLAIARALISERNVMILDEATAAIDPIREKELYELFQKASENKTTMFITHRLGSTKFADCIYVLKNGAIIEKGSHSKLMSEKTLYREMYNSQSRWYQ